MLNKFLFFLVGAAAQNVHLHKSHGSLGENNSFDCTSQESITELKNNCEIHAPQANGWSGGFCLASVSEAGWTRSTFINPVMAAILSASETAGFHPIITASNSGGSMFATRYFALRYQNAIDSWTYPCYLLARPFAAVCFFHSHFGTITNECYAEVFNTVGLAATMIYGHLFAVYGGPLGVASTYAAVYFPFLADLPNQVAHLVWDEFIARYAAAPTFYGSIQEWVVAFTLDAPLVASGGTNQYNYGFDSFMSRFITSIEHHNVSMAVIVAASANTQSAFNILPFALSGKSWDGVTSSTAFNAPLKLIALVLAFVMVKKLLGTYALMDVGQIAFPSRCTIGCPVMDGALTDNGPLTPIVSAATLLAEEIRPDWIISIGAASTMATVEFLMGSGALEIWSFGGINVCPFTVGGICKMASKVRVLLVDTLPTKSQAAYFNLVNSYGVYRPELQLLTPYCGDPLTYDLFAAECEADSVCDMWATIVPSEMNEVMFTTDEYIVVFVMTFLQATPVSARFVRNYMPEAVFDISYYEHMGSWFPNFDAMSPNKGGIGFTGIAGNSFLDFMTYLNIRLAGYLFETKVFAHEFSSLMDGNPDCLYHTYEKVENLTYTQPLFLGLQAKTHVMQDFGEMH